MLYHPPYTKVELEKILKNTGESVMESFDGNYLFFVWILFYGYMTLAGKWNDWAKEKPMLAISGFILGNLVIFVFDLAID